MAIPARGDGGLVSGDWRHVAGGPLRVRRALQRGEKCEIGLDWLDHRPVVVEADITVEQVMLHTAALWPDSSCRSWPLSASQIRMVPLAEPLSRARDAERSDPAGSEAPSTAAVAAVWERLGLDAWFAKQGADRGAVLLSEAVFAMVANRLIDPCSKRRLIEWVDRDVAM